MTINDKNAYQMFLLLTNDDYKIALESIRDFTITIWQDPFLNTAWSVSPDIGGTELTGVESY